MISAQGTSHESFKIGLSGTTLYQGTQDPTILNTVNDGDVWFNANTGTVQIYNSGTTSWEETAPPVSNPLQEKSLNQPGELIVTTGNSRWYPTNQITLTSVRATVGTAPVGSGVITNVRVNGTSIATPEVAAGGNTSAIIVLNTIVNTGDYVTVDVDQIGSATPGSDLVVNFGYEAN